MVYNSLQMGTVVAFVVTYLFATLLIAARYFQSAKVDKRFDLDLVVLTISYGLAMVYFITLVILMHYGWGRHMSEVSVEELIEFNKASRRAPRKYTRCTPPLTATASHHRQNLLPNTLTYLVIPSITKMAMLVVLYRINPARLYRRTVVAIALFILAYTLVLTSVTGGPCSPLKPGTLRCLESVAVSQAVLNIVSDLLVVATPIPTIHALISSTRQKVSVGCILALGSGVVICSIARLPYVLILETSADATYTEAILGVWSIVEVNLGIICGCAMRLKSLVTAYLPRLGLGSSSGRRKGKGGAGDEEAASSSNSAPPSHQGYRLHSIQKGSVGRAAASSEEGADGFRRSAEADAAGDGGSTDRILE